jgi:YbbR domain-containing protein
MILALIVAICLWAYVLGQVNPTVTITIRDIPITFLNEETLEKNGLTVLNTSANYVNITISGQRTAATRVKESDFKVTADLEALPVGESTVRLNVTGPSGVKIDNVNLEKITVNVDEKITDNKPINVVINGDVTGGKEAYVMEVSQSSVAVTGAKTLVDKVEYVKAIINAGELRDTAVTLVAELTPVNKDGANIENLTLAFNQIETEVILLDKKSVTLEVPIINKDSGDLERTVTVPKTVTIKGSEADLKNVTSITCKTLDLSNVDKDTTLHLEPILPTGIQLADESVNLTAKVTVKGVGKETFDFDQSNIEILNMQDGLTYTLGDVKFTVTVSGKQSIIKGMSASDIKITVNTEGISEGTHTVPVTITTDKDVSEIVASIESVEITIQ